MCEKERRQERGGGRVREIGCAIYIYIYIKREKEREREFVCV